MPFLVVSDWKFVSLPCRCRGKTVKLLGSNPFQIVLCVLVLVDAGVVIAEILLDLDAIRGQCLYYRTP